MEYMPTITRAEWEDQLSLQLHKWMQKRNAKEARRDERKKEKERRSAERKEEKERKRAYNFALFHLKHNELPDDLIEKIHNNFIVKKTSAGNPYFINI